MLCDISKMVWYQQRVWYPQNAKLESFNPLFHENIKKQETNLVNVTVAVKKQPKIYSNQVNSLSIKMYLKNDRKFHGNFTHHFPTPS